MAMGTDVSKNGPIFQSWHILLLEFRKVTATRINSRNRMTDEDLNGGRGDDTIYNSGAEGMLNSNRRTEGYKGQVVISSPY